MWAQFICLRTGLVAGSYKHVTETLGFMKGVGLEGLRQ